jgi:iron(III) transport system ATP-binding protein
VQMGTPEQLYHSPKTREVATFIGDADFIPCEVDGGRARCELGALPCACGTEGLGEVMLRPERVSLAFDPRSPHEVSMREFFGHDQMVTVRLSSGRSVRCRVGPGESYYPGDRVRIDVHGEVAVYSNGARPGHRTSSPRLNEGILVLGAASG